MQAYTPSYAAFPWNAALAAAFLHAAVIFGWSYEPAAVGVEIGGSAISVELVAGGTMSAESQPHAIDSAQDPEVPALKPPAEDLSAASTETETLPKTRAEKLLRPTQNRPAAKKQPVPARTEHARKTAADADSGALSPSEIAGKGTASNAPSSRQGAIAKAAPDYLRNPAPPYPAGSLRAGEEGIVLLRVAVDERGGVAEIALAASSGFDRLDNAALRAVKRWRFKPAAMGGLPVRDTVEVPVRFKIEA